MRRFLDYLPLCKHAWSEVSKEPFNPDLDLFRFCFDHGLMYGHIEEAGFFIFALNKHMFTSEQRAEVVTVWVRPEHRNTRKGVRLLRMLFKEAKKVGAKTIVFSVPVDSPNIFSWSNQYGNPVDFVFKRSL